MSDSVPLSPPSRESNQYQKTEKSNLANRRSGVTEETSASTWIVFLLLFGAVLATYLPAIRGEKVWDDAFLIGTNEFFRSPRFALEVFRHYLYPESFSLYYRPVQNLSYILDYWLWNEDAFGYHLSNILFHAFGAFLLYLVLSKVLTRSDRAGENSGERRNRSLLALVVALIWAVHPIHHAAVAYIAGRADSLATMFSLGAWLLYLHAREWHSVRTRVGGLLVVLFLAVLALGSKEIAITWMTLFLVWALFFDLEASRRDKVRAVICVFAALLVYWLIRQLPEARHAAPGRAGEPFPERLILVLRALGDYSRVLFLPTELHMERTILGDAPLASWHGFFDRGGLAPIGLCIAAVVTVFCLWKARGRKVRILGAVWFLIGFVPVSNLIPLNATVAEHWIYMASIGAILFVLGCILALPPRFDRAAGVTVAVVIVGFSIRTAFKVRDWTSNERLFSQTIEATGGSARMNMNLAVVHLKQGELDVAETLLRDALQRFPDADPIRIKLASVLMKLGQSSEAESLLNGRPKAGDTLAAQHVAMWNEPILCAKLRFAEGNADDAIEILELAELRFPHIWAVCAVHAQILNEKSGPNAAIALVENYTESHWWSYPGHMLLGRLRTKAGDFRGAIIAFQKASALDIHAAEPWLAIAEIQSARRDTEAMKAALGEAISRDPAAVKVTGFLDALLDKLAAAEAQK